MPRVDEGTTHNVCGVNGCLQCHCHYCAAHWQEKAEQLQIALKRYGAHQRECAWADAIAPLRGVVPCTCGLAALLEKTP